MVKGDDKGNVREVKAAAIDAAVKQELAREYASAALKTAKLKALRLAREAAEHAAKTEPRSKAGQPKQSRRRS